MDEASEITISLANVVDTEILTHTCKRAFDSDKDYGAPGPGGPPGVDSIEWNLGIIKNQYLDYYKIVEGNDIVGGFIAEAKGQGYKICQRIWLDPDHMRKGIGMKTFDLIWDKYPSTEVWVLGTPEWNSRTNPFYQKVGFVQIGKTFDFPSWDGIYYEKRNVEGLPKAISRIEDLHETGI